MISLIETLHYCCLKHGSRPLSSFNVLVGPNASGKTTFLDVISFLSRLVSEGPEAAVAERTANFYDLVWGRTGYCFELAIEAALPGDIRERLADQQFSRIRYEVSIGMNSYDEISILAETGLLRPEPSVLRKQREIFPERVVPPETIQTSLPDTVRIFCKTPHGNDEYYPQVHQGEENRKSVFRLGPRKSTLGNLPEDTSLFPASTWLKELLTQGVQQLVLNGLLIRRASPPGQTRGFRPDGSNLPWVISRLRQSDPERFQDWIVHLQTALPEIEDILVKEREDDRHRYLTIRYQGSTEVPSWMLSDGTLRLLALT
ncbi:MAG TPA: ATP-binding protein, partial [Desulfobacterales bacterium]|nr:ATP-binding protein [Desulfobacterales bacterium]